MHMPKLIIALIFSFALVFTSPAEAQRDKNETLSYAQAIATYCMDGQWQTKRCLDIMAKMNKVTAANYIADIKLSGRTASLKHVENGCAVATQINAQAMSAEALAEAYVLCINGMIDAEKETGIGPNKDYYNMMLLGYFCTSGNAMCTKFETGLKKSLPPQ